MTEEHEDDGSREHFFRCQDGLRLFYRGYGDPASSAIPVLCLSGLTRNSQDFAAVARRISNDGRRVYCLDYRGRGRSERDPAWRRYQPRTYVDDIRHLLIAESLHRVAVIGTSLGAVLAMAMGAAMPTVLAGAVLNDAGPEITPQAVAPILAYLQDQAPLAGWPEVVERLRRHFPDNDQRSPEEWLRYAKRVYRRDDDGRIRPDWDPAIARPLLRKNGQSADLWPLYRSLRRFPVLVVRGARSEILSESTLTRMTEGMPLVATTTVAGVGHAPTLSEPEAAAAIDAWLRRL
jgi:pimeloyl-ACP methyl ester carboxylesterase